jgi:hypothetical protein
MSAILKPEDKLTTSLTLFSHCSMVVARIYPSFMGSYQIQFRDSDAMMSECYKRGGIIPSVYKRKTTQEGRGTNQWAHEAEFFLIKRCQLEVTQANLGSM